MCVGGRRKKSEWEEMKRDGKRWEEMGRDGKRWEEMGREEEKNRTNKQKRQGSGWYYFLFLKFGKKKKN